MKIQSPKSPSPPSSGNEHSAGERLQSALHPPPHLQHLLRRLRASGRLYLLLFTLLTPFFSLTLITFPIMSSPVLFSTPPRPAHLVPRSGGSGRRRLRRHRRPPRRAAPSNPSFSWAARLFRRPGAALGCRSLPSRIPSFEDEY